MVGLGIPANGSPIETARLANHSRLSYLALCLIGAGASVLFLWLRFDYWAAIFGGIAIVVAIMAWRPELNPGRNTIWQRARK